MAKNTKKTSINVGTLASKTLKNPSASKIAKSLAASALSQTRSNKQTSSQLEGKASKVLQSNKYNVETKKLAGSVLSQSNKER